MPSNEMEPAHRSEDQGSEPIDEASASTALEPYQHNPADLYSVRLALWDANDGDVHRAKDHQVVTKAKNALTAGHLKTRMDPCDESVYKNKQIRDFIDAHRKDAQRIANSLNTALENILGLSALESAKVTPKGAAYGESRFAKEGNNFFGLHGNSKHPLPNQIGLIPAHDDPSIGVAKFDSYYACAESFAKTKGQLIIGVTDPKKFVKILQDKGRFGIGPNGPIPTYVRDVVNVIQNVAQRLNCH